MYPNIQVCLSKEVDHHIKDVFGNQNPTISSDRKVCNIHVTQIKSEGSKCRLSGYDPEMLDDTKLMQSLKSCEIETNGLHEVASAKGTAVRIPSHTHQF